MPLSIVVVFDSILRPDTTGGYVVAALRDLGHRVHHYEPLTRNAAGALVARGYADLVLRDVDFVLFVDGDIAYPVLQAPLPRYYWCIDTHRMDQLVGGGTRWERVRKFDRVFYAQRDRARELGGTWLPLA